MSVPEGKRGVNRLAVFVKARALSTYTIRICSNEKVFDVKYQRSITDDLVKLAKDIFADIWAANNIVVVNATDYNTRRELQKKAERECTQLIAMIQIAKPLFHLAMKRCKYWAGLTGEIRTMIKAWAESDRKRYSAIL